MNLSVPWPLRQSAANVQMITPVVTVSEAIHVIVRSWPASEALPFAFPIPDCVATPLAVIVHDVEPIWLVVSTHDPTWVHAVVVVVGGAVVGAVVGGAVDGGVVRPAVVVVTDRVQPSAAVAAVDTRNKNGLPPDARGASVQLATTTPDAARQSSKALTFLLIADSSTFSFLSRRARVDLAVLRVSAVTPLRARKIRVASTAVICLLFT